MAMPRRIRRRFRRCRQWGRLAVKLPGTSPEPPPTIGSNRWAVWRNPDRERVAAILQLGEDRTGIIVRAQLSSVDVAQVHVGDITQVNIAGREQRTGKVSQISPKMSANMGSFEVEIRLDDPKDIKSGEVAEVLIAAKPVPGQVERTAYLIPAISLIDARADQGMVYVVSADGKATRRSIQTEGITDAGVVVIGGLEPGEAIITRGASMVRDGDTVKFRQE